MEGNSFICQKCGNSDLRFVGFIKGKPYCRKCIQFVGSEVEQTANFPKNASIFINYALSPEQQGLSDALLTNYRSGVNTLVNAVCGSGKTEIVLQIISNAIKAGERVAFAVPRRDVAIELFDRFKNIFKFNKLALLCGGHTKTKEADLLILTTHQLYRYNKYFDLLILDEIDAFPFYGNEVLTSFFFRALRGNYVMLSATPDEATLKYFSQKGHDILSLNKRFHRYLLPVPQTFTYITWYRLIATLKILKGFLSKNKQVFVFAPTIDECEKLFSFLKLFAKSGACVHSKKEQREQIITDFKNQKYQYLVTTAVLERGVTVKDLQVIVYHADSEIYTDAALIQIAGRAGRKKDAPIGEVVYIAKSKTKSMEESIRKIKLSNTDL